MLSNHANNLGNQQINRTKHATTDLKLNQKLHTAMKFVTDTCIFGAENKIHDIKKTHGWVYFLNKRRTIGHFVQHKHITNSILQTNPKYDIENEHFTYPDKKEWYYEQNESAALQNRGNSISFQIEQRKKEDPLADPEFNLNDAQISLLQTALLVQELRVATCNLRANLLAKYLWEHNEGINRIEVVNASDFEHTFVIVNRIGNLKDSNTWGNAWIIDPWFDDEGIIYPASEFKLKIKEIKNFFERQVEECDKVGIGLTNNPSDIDGRDTYCLSRCEINPQFDRYPTYSTDPFYPLEHYYLVDIFPREESDVNYTKRLNDNLNIYLEKLEVCHDEMRKKSFKPTALYHRNYAFINAAKSGDLNTVKKFVTQGGNINFVTKEGITAIYIAAQNGRLEVVEYLVSKNAKINTVTSDGKTPLFAAIQNNHMDIATFLKLHKALSFPASTSTTSPLIHAIECLSLEVIKFMCRNGAQINYRNEQGWSPITMSAELGKLDMVQFLVENGANVNHENIHGITALYLASQNGHTETVKYLLKNGARIHQPILTNGNTPIFAAVINGQLDIVKILIDQGAKLDAINKFGDTPLSIAVILGHLEIVKYLISRNADIAMQIGNEKTIVTLAIENGHVEVANYLKSLVPNAITSHTFFTPINNSSTNFNDIKNKELLSAGGNNGFFCQSQPKRMHLPCEIDVEPLPCLEDTIDLPATSSPH